MSDLALYTSEDGKTRLGQRIQDGIAWLSQLEIAELFQTTKNNVPFIRRTFSPKVSWPLRQLLRNP